MRLGSRSPKDSYETYKKKYCYHTGEEAVKALCDSERVSDDLYLARANGYTPHIAVREWVPIEPWQEFRCFVRNRKLAGISQYNYLHREVFPEIRENAGRIEWALRKKTELIAPLLPDNVVVDYIYRMRQSGNMVVNEAVLLEINPWMPYTDPCLFDWSKDRFEEFEFRFCR
ncbi:MAG: cell division cycle 123 family protein [Peptococcaceae bacterium]|nr:cell division cycle 123 family protein [Peptococcaceae bacterium]